MNKIVYPVIATAALFVIGACAHNQPQAQPKGQSLGKVETRSHTPKPTDHFRINMRSDYGPHSGPTANAAPTPFPPDTQWFDVNNWQQFLNTHGYPCTPDNMFGPNTTLATKSFQASTPCGALPKTGMVNQTTYDKAVCRGMTPYPTVIGAHH